MPEDQDLTRKAYRYILERLKFRNEYNTNQPELKNFFYIYKNYTINDDYKKILEDYYLTEVRSVERYNDHEPEDKKEEVSDIIPPNESLPSDTSEKLISYAVEDTPVKVDVTHSEYKPAKNIKEQIKLVKTNDEEIGDDEETMVAVEARNHARSLKVLSGNNDVVSSISVNSVGKKSSKSKLRF